MEPLVESNPTGPIPIHIALTDTRNFLQGAYKLLGGGTETSPTSIRRLLDFNPGTTSSTLPLHQPPPCRPGWFLHHFPLQEGQLYPEHQLRRLD